MSFEIRVGHIPGFLLPSVAILSRLCRKRRKAIFTHSQSVRQSEGYIYLGLLFIEKSKNIIGPSTEKVNALYVRLSFLSG